MTTKFIVKEHCFTDLTRGAGCVLVNCGTFDTLENAIEHGRATCVRRMESDGSFTVYKVTIDEATFAVTEEEAATFDAYYGCYLPKQTELLKAERDKAMKTIERAKTETGRERAKAKVARLTAEIEENEERQATRALRIY